MNKLKLLLITAIAVMTFSITSFASGEMAVENVLPDEVSILVTIDPANLKEPVKKYYEDTALTVLLSTVIDGGSDTSVAKSVMDYLLEKLSTTKLTFASWLPKSDIVVLIPLSESDYQKNIETPFLSKGPSVTESNISIYSPIEGNAGGSVYSYTNGFFVIGNSEEAVKKVINGPGEHSLSTVENFTKTKSQFLEKSAMDVYVNIQSFVETFGQNESLSSTEYMLTTGFSLEQKANSFKFKSYTITDPEKVKALGIDYDDNATLSLYKNMPKDNPLYFVDDSSHGKTIFQTLKSMPDYQQAKNEFFTDFQINLDDLLPLFNNETAFLINDSGDFLPSMTFLADMGSNNESIKKQMDSLLNLAWTSLLPQAKESTPNKLVFDEEEDEFIVILTKNALKIDGSDVIQYKIEITQKPSKNPYAVKLSKELSEYTLTVGAVDKIYLISTDKNIDKNYNKGLQNNPEIKAMINNNVDFVTYIDIAAANVYIKKVITTLEKDLQGNADDAEELKKVYDKMMGAWKAITVSVTTKNSYTSSEGEIGLNLSQFIKDIADLAENYSELSDTTINLAGNSKNSLVEFEDVDTSDWYGDNVYYLTSQGIVGGYGDDTFKPGQNINRAEFTKLVITALEEKGYSYRGSYKQGLFRDISDYSWYYTYVLSANDRGLISGYKDGTFKPEQSITRAEAAQILTNVIKTYNLTAKTENAPIEFTDIKGDEWFTEAVNTVNKFGIMQGNPDKKFEPNRNINRAESAKVIRNLMENL